MLEWLDDAIKDQADQFGGQYCTAVYGVLERREPLDSENDWCFRFVLGGHPRPVLIPAGEAPRLVGEPGSVLGLLDNPVFHETELPLSAGDTVLLYTDGVTDVAGPSALDDAGLLAVVAEAIRDSPEATVTALYQALEARHAARRPRRDDTAILALHCPIATRRRAHDRRSSSRRCRRARAGPGDSCATRSNCSTCPSRRSTTPSSSRPSW